MHEAEIAVGKCTELLYNLLVLVGILVGTDMYIGTYEYGVITLEVFSEERVEEDLHIIFKEVEVVETILLRAKLLTEAREAE